jgi:F-type H+-transporting ATPase subunit b
LADFNICWINFIIEKICLKPILDAVNEEKKESKNALLSAENAKKEMLDLQADNQRICKKQD